MTPKIPDDPIDRELEQAQSRDRAMEELRTADGFLVVTYRKQRAGQADTHETGSVYWGSPAFLVFYAQLWLRDILDLVDGEGKE